MALAHTQVLDHLERESLKQHEFQVSWALRVYRGLRVHRYRVSRATWVSQTPRIQRIGHEHPALDPYR